MVKAGSANCQHILFVSRNATPTDHPPGTAITPVEPSQQDFTIHKLSFIEAVGVTVCVGVCVGVLVKVGVCVGVLVKVGVCVGVDVGVGVGVGQGFELTHESQLS